MRVHSSWLAVATSLLLVACVSGSLNKPALQPAIDMRHQYKNSYLHVEGARLLAANGREVAFHGINLGGWLVTETWMCGFLDGQDMEDSGKSTGTPGRSTLESLESRFGPQKAAALMNIWQDHWITVNDLDRIRNDGFNVIRVPIGYRTLQHPDGSWLRDARGQIDFARMDWIVRESARRGIYTIFDLHVWPEQRIAYEKIGRPDGADIRASMARLWTAVAAHYRGNGAIAAFDLINEFPGNWGVQQILSRAVSKGDPDRVQIIEGFTFAEFLELHKEGEFRNSIFSEHLYGAKPLSTEEFNDRLKEIRDSPVPVYIGEFLAADFAAATQAMNRFNFSWSSWTYKTVDMGDWGAFNYYSGLKTNIQHDTFQAIETKWSADLTAWQTPGAARNYFVNDNRRPSSTLTTRAPLL